jgi:putative FmdB family regulatory protein
MPAYLYKCRKCGRTETVVCSFEDRPRMAPARCEECDGEMVRNFGGEHRGTRHKPGNWPILSDALGCNPSQIQESMEVASKHGVPTEFTPDGRAILTGPAHRKAYARLYGFHDRNGGFGDP